jgi:hypothetical protein
MSVTPGATLDGESFIDIGGQDYRVFAVNRWGAGHFMAWCDASTLGELIEEVDVAGYLGQKAAPKVASAGNYSTCAPGIVGVPYVPDWVEYLGSEIPAMYLGHPELLAADYDVLILCGYHTAWEPAWVPLIGSFVTEYGKGFLAVMDYVGYDITETDFTRMSEITADAGIIFDPLSLAHAPTATQVVLECVPDLPPPPR